MHSQTAQISEELPIEQLSVSEVNPEVAASIWPTIEPMIARALRHGQGDNTTPEYVLAAILQKLSTLWVAHDGNEILGCVVFRVQEQDVCRKVWIDFIAGRDFMRWYRQTHDLLLDYMEVIGAKCIEGSCRPGMARFLKKMGSKQKAIIMESTR